MDGASVIEDTWLRARAGEHGYLSGKDAEAIACDALVVPVVTGSPDWALIGQMITLVADAYAHAADAQHGLPAQPGQPARPQPPPPLPPEQWQDLQYALASLAINFVSGPGALASALRRGLLGAPLNGKSVILDVGYSDTIPESIRKAVIARDKGCAWPGGCDRRPAACDVHHVKHKKHGGKTSVRDCVMLCQYHHDICVHRMGWEFELLPDGSTRATSPDRQSRPPQPRATTDNPTQRRDSVRGRPPGADAADPLDGVAHDIAGTLGRREPGVRGGRRRTASVKGQHDAGASAPSPPGSAGGCRARPLRAARL